MSLKLSPEARSILRAVQGEIRKRLILRGSEAYLERFRPTSLSDEILRRQAYLKDAFKTLKPEVRRHIGRVRPLTFRREYLHDRILIVEPAEVEAAERLGLCDVSTNPEDGWDYELVLSTVGYGIEVELKPEAIAPELYVLPLWEGRETLKALSDIARITNKESVAAQILAEVEKLREPMGRAQLIENLDELVAEKEGELNRIIGERLERFSLTLNGKELLNFLSRLREGDYDAMLAGFDGIRDEVEALVSQKEGELSGELGVPVEIFSRDGLYPIRASPEGIEKLRRGLERDLKVELYLRSREIAAEVKPLLPALKEEIKEVYELDFLSAVMDFTSGFSFPILHDGGTAFIGGRHLFIEDPQPVSYAIGKRPQGFQVAGAERIGDEDVVILTGANSGGKTSLLELMAQVIILTHMGLPVPAEMAWVEPVEELFFFRRKRSSYGAGAFETALKSFVRALRGSGRKVLLIDEFEAITEPGAAVKIIGKLLEVAHGKGFRVVIVSHLGEDLRKALPFARVDGIEARGLDEGLNLVVDRQPVFGRLGRSTPELIVERLAKKARGEESEIFRRVLDAFDRGG